MSTTNSAAERPSLLRWLRFPLTVLALPALAIGALMVVDRVEGYEEAIFPLFMIIQFTVMFAIVALAVWFLFFSGVRLFFKALVILLIVGGIAGLVSVTREVVFTGEMMPVFVFNWGRDHRKELEERLQTVSARSGDESVLHDVAVRPDDFPRYRGVNGDGVAPATPLPKDWGANPPKELWRVVVGDGHAGIAVAGQALVTIEQRGDSETVVCYERDTGKEVWSFKYEAHFRHSAPMGGSGPRSTPTIVGGDVYSLGATGELVCLDARTGKPRWRTNVIKDSGAKNLEWGMSGSPLVTDELVIVNPGVDLASNQNQAVAAYDRKTGKRAWAAGDQLAGYSSPRLVTLADFQQVLLFDGGGVAGIDPADGKELWRYPWKTFSDMNIIQPLVVPGDRVFISSEVANGCALLQVKKDGEKWSVAPVWQNRKMAAKFANPVYHANHIYGLNKGTLCCLNAETGKRLWQEGEVGSGQLLLTGDYLIVQTELGEVFAAAAEPSGYRELGRLRVFDDRTWNTLALAGGRLYMRNHKEMACLELPK